MHLLANGRPHALHNGIELGPGHDPRLRPAELVRGYRADTVGGLEDGVVNLELLVIGECLLPLAALEARGDLVGPPLEAGVDGLDVDAGVAADALAELGPRDGAPGAVHAGVLSRLCDGLESGRRGWLEGRGGLAEEAIVGLVAELVRLGEAFVARRRGAVATHDGRGVVGLVVVYSRVMGSELIVVVCLGTVGDVRGAGGEKWKLN